MLEDCMEDAMFRKAIILAGFAIVSAGCSTISEESCIAGSWESLGYEDGRNGESRSHFNKIAKTCAKYGVSANAIDYRAGYDTGLQQYCSYDKGFSHGEAGNSEKAECREINATPYLTGYNEGLPLYCSFDRGFSHGESGNSIKGKCRNINSIPYLDGYEEGAIVYALRQEYSELVDVYDETRAALEDVGNRLANFDMDEKNRTRLRKKKRRLERELDDVRIDIRAFERIQGWSKKQLPLPNYGEIN